MIEAARAYVGCPFHHQGRVHDGMDCIGLLVLAHEDAGLALEDCTTYARHPDPEQLLHHLRRNFDEVPAKVAGPGDVLVFWMRKVRRQPGEPRERLPQHVALLTDYGLIHTWSQVARGRGEQGKVVETVFDDAWRRRVLSAWRHPGRVD